MKMLPKFLAVVVLAASTLVYAANFEGTYTFSSRTKEGNPEMQGWSGTMVIKGNEVNRTYKSSDNTQEKFYTSTFKQDGNIYVLTHTKAYKPEYVGNEHRNKFLLNGNTLVIESEDGKFQETWNKK